MIDIDKKLVRRLAGSVIYERGEICAQNNNVQHIEVEAIEMGNNKKTVSIESQVKSSSSEEIYEVFVRFVEGSNFLDCSCDCKYWGSICKHAVAALLTFIDRKEFYLTESQERKSRELIDGIKSNFILKNSLFKKHYVNLGYKLDIENKERKRLSLEIKIGEDKLYVVKNIKDFIESILFHRELYFGKGFTFNPYMHKFKDEDKKIIELLCDIYETDSMLQDIYINSNTSQILIKGKKAYLTERNMNKFFKNLGDRRFEINIDGEVVKDVYVKKENFPLDFEVKSNDDKITIKQNTNIPISLSDSGRYFFYDGKIYEPTRELVQSYKIFFNEFKKGKKLEVCFDSIHSEELATFVIPVLRKITTKLNVDENFKNKFYEEPLQAMVYLDKDKDKVVADIIFKYGNEKVSPFHYLSKDKSKILIRNVDEERTILSILERFKFKRGKVNYFLQEEENILDFILNGIETLQHISEVYYSDSFKNIKIHSKSNYKSSVKLNNEDLLEFTFSIEGVNKKELKDIFESLRQKKKYHRLKDGGFIHLLNDEMSQMGNLIEYLNIKPSELQKEKIILPKHNAVYIDSVIRDSGISFIEKNRSFKQLVNSIKDLGQIDYSVPEKLDNIMRSYQKFGFKWFKTLSSCGFGGILADEMGLGKTLQTIAFIKSEIDSNSQDKMPSVVICPTSLVYNWQDEVNKFQPDLNCIVISGSREQREKCIESIRDADLVITSYALIRRDIEDYSNLNFRYCFLDEAQNIKNPQSLSAQSVKSIKAKGYFALTGTPIENSLTELWSIFDFIMPGYLLNQRSFSKKYEVPILKDRDEIALAELNRHIKPFILRRLKRDVIKELPPKIEHNVIVDMDDEQKRIYASFADKAREEMGKDIRESGFNKNRIKILALLTRLRQLCCDPSIFIENYEGGNGKLEVLLNIVENNINAGHKILIFSQFTSVLKNISKKFNKSNIKHLYLDGSIKSELRGDLIKEFNEGDASVFLISLKAGGTGLNLTSADIVIHFDPWWNPAVEQQASDRAHRIGQKNTVEVIRLIAKGSIEEKIYKIQEKKKKIIESVIDENEGEELLLSNMNEKEIQELLS